MHPCSLLSVNQTDPLPEGGGIGGQNEVAGQHRLGGAAPDAALDHRDHGRREGFDLAHELAQRIVPAQRVAPRGRELVDLVTG